MKNKSACDFAIKRSILAFSSISVYRALLRDKTLKSFKNLILSVANTETDLQTFLDRYNTFFYNLTSGTVLNLKQRIIDMILFDENAFSLRVEASRSGSVEDFIKHSAIYDLGYLQQISEITSSDIKNSMLNHFSGSEIEKEYIMDLPSWNFSTYFHHDQNETYTESIRKVLYKSDNWSDCIKQLADYHAEYGCGKFALYRAFSWKHTVENRGFLKGIPYPDPVKLSDFINYDQQRKEIIENTLQFLKGYPANNMLLYGDRGTGKSSTVKAVLNEYFDKKLRLVEVKRDNLSDFPKIVNALRNRNYKFIIFVDDLAFEDNEENYTALKAVLEGSVEVCPDNILIYATSNRRHIIKEKFSDRTGLMSEDHDEEVRALDTMQEKLSLSDRFGITVVFSSPDKKTYLNIVDGLAEKRGLKVEKDLLHKEALKWELWYNKRSPRTAMQFIDWLEGKIGVEHQPLI